MNIKACRCESRGGKRERRRRDREEGRRRREKERERERKGETYALFPCPGVNVLPSARVTGSKGDPLAKTHFLNGKIGWETM